MNLATQAINTEHEFADISYMTLIKHTANKRYYHEHRENEYIYKYKLSNQLINEQVKINKIHGMLFKTLNSENIVLKTKTFRQYDY